MPRCLNHSRDCSGEVTYYLRESDYKQFPRCDFHQKQHEELLARSLGRYSDSDIPPTWFDPTFAGEVWDEY